MASLKMALLRFAARQLRYVDVLRFLKSAKDRNDLHDRMKLVSNMRGALFANTQLWPSERRDWEWQEVLAGHARLNEAMTRRERGEG
ncbi:MAG: hypothetical protein HY927_06155 [Elusimicrobia bacterium]|nr:hypothetical protein [Elusimicrobiota bacterium]